VKAAQIVRDAVGTRFTGAVLRIEHGGRALWEEACGAVDDSAEALPVEVTTRFDLASLTKPFVAAAVLRAVSDGLLELDAPLAALLPEWRGRPHAAITPRMLLAHTSGMQSGADYRVLIGDNVERFALAQELGTAPRERVVYSDLGFIALGVVLERVYSGGLAMVLKAACARLGAEATGFRPRAVEIEAIPATEEDAWRGRVRGTVHDEKAHLMNGVAGHAGLFGTARDVATLAEAFLGAAYGRRNDDLPVRFAREAITEQGKDAILRRGLGWALKTSDENSCGAVMSRATFGHTGFTGTSVWSDPARDLTVVLLTNAVYYGRNDLRDVRAAVCDEVAMEVDRCARSA
jgi:CubicO group peptidase (beta-lactamase class C family)